MSRIVWHELVSRDAERAAAFYSQLFGWGRTTRGWQHRLANPVPAAGKDEPDLRPVASVTQLPAEEAGDWPSLWMVFVHVGEEPEEMDALLEPAMRGGLRAISPPVTGPRDGGRLGFRLLDHRAALTVPLTHDRVTPPAPPMLGCFCWNQLTVHEERFDDLGGVLGALFGWKLEGGEERGGSIRGGDDGGAVGGWQPMRPESDAPDHWLPFVRVDDVYAVAASAPKLGGRIVVEPRPHPRRSDERDEHCAVVEDPTGGVIGLRGWAPAEATAN